MDTSSLALMDSATTVQLETVKILMDRKIGASTMAILHVKFTARTLLLAQRTKGGKGVSIEMEIPFTLDTLLNLSTDNVWWNIGKPHPECKIIVMSPVGQEVPGTNCGNVVLSTDQAGCFFTNLDHTFMVQYCCGTDNCAAALGASKRDLQDIPALMARAEAGVMDGESFAFPVVST